MSGRASILFHMSRSHWLRTLGLNRSQCSRHSTVSYSKPIFTDPFDAVRDIPSGSTILVGGFGMCGVPEGLISGLQRTGVNNLTIISNNGGVKEFGLGLLLQNHQIKRMISSYIGENPEFERQYLQGELEVEFNPQGTMIERVRAGAAGIPAFYTRTGYGTLIHKGNCPIKFDSNGTPIILSKPKDVRSFNGTEYVLEEGIVGDFALIRAWKADKAGNLIFRKTAQNFNSTMAKGAKVTVVEVEHLLPIGAIEADSVHLSGIYVDRILTGASISKHIERRVLYEPPLPKGEVPTDPKKAVRYRICGRAVLELKDGMYVNLGIGIPTLLPRSIPPELTVHIHTENGLIGVGPYPTEDHVDADLINAGKETVTELPGASYCSSAESFEMIRGGHIDLSFLGAMQVSQYGDLSNWAIPGKLIKGMGGAMDLAAAPNTKIIVLMEHVNQNGQPKIVPECDLPLTGLKCVDSIITEMGVFSVDPHKGLTLEEVAENVHLDDIRQATSAKFNVSSSLKMMPIG